MKDKSEKAAKVSVMPITNNTLDPDGRKEADGLRVDVHLSCIIVLNARAAILASETMLGRGVAGSSLNHNPIPLLAAAPLVTHTHTRSTTISTN